MVSQLYRISVLLISALEKWLKPRFLIRGEEKIDNHPTLFVPNHFTRAETFIVPYILFKLFKEQVRSLAANEVFVGKLGKYLRSIKVISTKDPLRNRTIIHDLISGEYRWLIYPEGLMIKNKEIFQKGNKYLVNTPVYEGMPKTGAAVLALKSQLIKEMILENIKKGNRKKVNYYLKRFDLDLEQISELSTVIVPINITYYPIRPQENPISKMAGKFIKEIPKRLNEELLVEGSLINNTDITINFNSPIDLAKFIKPIKKWTFLLPISNEKKINFILGRLRHRLTQKFMSEIYNSLSVNFDHLFTWYLYHHQKEYFDPLHCRLFLVATANYLSDESPFNYHPHLKEDLKTLLIQTAHPLWDSIFEFSLKSDAIYKKENHFFINKKMLHYDYDFHEIRLKNTLKIIYNEIKPLSKLTAILNNIYRQSHLDLSKAILNYYYNTEVKNYQKVYRHFYDPHFSKSLEIGKPQLYFNPRFTQNILLCHGYKAAPMEVEEMAKCLFEQGFNVYCPRLPGHGTAPINIKEITWMDWSTTYTHALSALKSLGGKIYAAGFSTGGTLALLQASQFSNQLAGCMAINAPIRLADIKSIFVPAIATFNQLLDQLNLETPKKEYIDDRSENPQINYSRNYLHGVKELKNLMSQTEKELKKITCPVLIIQATKDPVVNPKSANIILSAVQSTKKKLVEIEANNHVIIREDKQKQVFELVLDFLKGQV